MAARAKAPNRDVEKMLRACERQLPGCVSGGASRNFQVRSAEGVLVIVTCSKRAGGRAVPNARAALRREGFQL